MKKQVTGWIITGLLCFVGCVPSLHELYTDDTVVYDPAILGDWQQDDATWSISGDPNAKSYRIVIIERDEKRGKLESKLDGRLVELDGKRYLDVFPDKDVALNVGNWFQAGLLRAHLFFKQEFKDGTMLLSVMDPDAFKKMVEQKPDIVKHEKTEDTIVLTASPRELQAFMKKYGGAEGFFGKPIELKPKIIKMETDESDDTATD
jgi:hypothetical protein